MVKESFIKEAYTNICKNKDTHFYNFIKGNTNHSFSDPEEKKMFLNINNPEECKKKCIGKWNKDCGFYILNDTKNDQGEIIQTDCTTFKLNNDDLNYGDYQFLIDCGGKNYKDIPLTDDTNNPVQLSPHDGLIFNTKTKFYNNGGNQGRGFVNPKIYRENPQIFRNVNFAEELVIEIIDLFNEIKESVKDFAQKANDNTTEEYNLKIQWLNELGEDFDPNNHNYSYRYTADLYVYQKLIAFYKKIDLLSEYLDVEPKELFYSIIPQSSFNFRIKLDDPITDADYDYHSDGSKTLKNTVLDPGTNSIPANFQIDYNNFHLTDQEFTEKDNRNLIIQINVGSEKVFTGTELESDNQFLIAKKFLDLKKKKNNLEGEEENLEKESNKQKQTLIVYALIFAIGIITITGFINTKISIILFIISIFIILFINYYMDIKNLINFKDYIKHI